MSTEWQTKNVLAKNIRAGDRMSFLNRKTMREVRHPIKSVDTEDDGQVKVSFGGRMSGWAARWRPRESVRIQRKKVSK
jgi:hypothetical protein